MKKIQQLVGETPLLQLNSPNLFLKLEKTNPTGSIKDRAVAQIIQDYQESGKLKAGDTIMEATSGNTGIALSLLAKQNGYHALIFMPSSMSKERQQLMKAYGATLILTDAKKGMQGSMDAMMETLAQHPDYKLLNQFNSLSNVKAHYLHTGPEILRDLPEVDVIVAGVGTGGTISGLGRYFKEMKSEVKIVAVEPASSPLLTEGKSGSHKIQGIGANFVPSILDQSVVDEIITITDEEAYQGARRLAKEEGILVGLSSGAAYMATLKLRQKYKDKNIVMIAPDGADKYISNGIFDETPESTN